MKRTLLLIVFLAVCVPQKADAKTIRLCVDQRNWYPFLYIAERELVHGIHVDIVKKALKSLGYDFTISAYPRKQCIIRVRNKEVDGMISIAYHPDLAPFCQFPPKAETAKRSKWRIMQVDYMVVTHRSDAYKFKGDPHSLPNPIRIPFGETIASDMRKDGFNIDDGAKDDRRNFLKLLRDENGVVITTSVMAERFLKELNIPDQIKIHSIPFKSQSYYLAFSTHNQLSSEEKQKIWSEIVRWRNDYVFMLQLFAKY